MNYISIISATKVCLFLVNVRKYLKFRKLGVIINHLIHYSVFGSYLFNTTPDLKVLTSFIVLLVN